MSDEVFKNPKFEKIKVNTYTYLMLIQFHTLNPCQPYKYYNK